MTWTVLIALHAAGATLAVVLGGWLLLRSSKGSGVHRRVGRIWMVDMYWVSLSSFGIRRLRPGHFSLIHLLSVWTLISLTMAWRAARRGDRDSHRGWVVGTYLGLLGAGIAASAVPGRLIFHTAAHTPEVLIGAFAAVATIAAGIIAGIVAGTRRSTGHPTEPELVAAAAAGCSQAAEGFSWAGYSRP